MEVDEFAERFEQAVASFPTALRPDLLRLLDASDEERAREIGRLHQSDAWRRVAELLIDLEEWPEIRKLVSAELRALSMRGRQ